MNLFKRRGLLFIPISFTGWLVFACVVIYAVYTLIDVDSRSHSVSDTLMNFVFNLFIIAIIYSAIAFFTSSRTNE